MSFIRGIIDRIKSDRRQPKRPVFVGHETDNKWSEGTNIMMEETHAPSSQELEPLLRAIWYEGYTSVGFDYVGYKVLLTNKDKKYIKHICLHKYRRIIQGLSFKRYGEGMWFDAGTNSKKVFMELIKQKL